MGGTNARQEDREGATLASGNIVDRRKRQAQLHTRITIDDITRDNTTKELHASYCRVSDKKKASTPIIVDVQADPKSLLFGGGSITAKSRWILFRGDRFFLPNHPTSIGL